MFSVCGRAVERGIDLLPPKLVERQLRKRGRPYAFERLKGVTTALVVVDMTNLFFDDNPKAHAAAAQINQMAAALRAAGGTVLWVRPASLANTALVVEHLGDGPAAHYQDAVMDEGGRNALHASLAVRADDPQMRKTTYSAFFPGTCDAPKYLHSRRSILS